MREERLSERIRSQEQVFMRRGGEDWKCCIDSILAHL